MADFAKPLNQLGSRKVAATPAAGQGLALDLIGLVPTAALGTGSADSSVFLAGDRVWRTVAGGGTGADGGVGIVASNTTWTAGTITISGFGAATVNTAASLVRISVPVQTAQTGISGVAASNTTYTSGTLTITGVGGGVTVSSNTGQRIDISVAAPVAQTAQTGISGIAGSNTTYTSGTVLFSGVGNGITVSSNTGQRIDLSVAAQTVQTQNLHNVTLSGNTAGVMAQISSGTLTLAGGNNITLSQAGNAVTVSAGAGGAATAISGIANSQTTYTSGSVTLASHSLGHPIDILSTTGQQFNISAAIALRSIFVTNTTYTANAITFSGANMVTVKSTAIGNGVIIDATQSVQTQGIVPVLTYFDNAGADGVTNALASTAMTFNTLLLQPLTPFNENFPGAMTVSTAMLQFSVSATASSSHSSTVGVGVYTRVNQTQLSLLNSVQTTWAQAAATNQTASYHGQRWVTIHSSAWSASPTFSQGQYWLGMFVRSSNASHTGSFLGQFLQGQNQRSGTIMSSVATNTTMGHYPFMGIHSVSQTAFPATIGNADINKVHALANFIPNIVFNNITGSF